jgi:hypothetical protein
VLASYKKASTTSFHFIIFHSPLWVTTSKISSAYGLLVFLSHALFLECISCEWLDNFGWIFLQLGLNSLGFFDEVSKFLQFFVMLLMFMVKLLFFCKKYCLLKL